MSEFNQERARSPRKKAPPRGAFLPVTPEETKAKAKRLALAHCSGRETSRKKLGLFIERKLHGAPGLEEAVLWAQSEALRIGLVDDARCARFFFRREVARGALSKALSKARFEHAFDETVVEQTLHELRAEGAIPDEDQALNEALERLALRDDLSSPKARDKAARRLIRKGFPIGAVFKALKNLAFSRK